MFGYKIGTLLSVFLIETVLSLTLIDVIVRRKRQSTSVKPRFSRLTIRQTNSLKALIRTFAGEGFFHSLLSHPHPPNLFTERNNHEHHS